MEDSRAGSGPGPGSNSGGAPGAGQSSIESLIVLSLHLWSSRGQVLVVKGLQKH